MVEYLFHYICSMSKGVICIGAAMVDELYYCSKEVQTETSNPAILKRSAGGVARNIAFQLALLKIPVLLFSAIGRDSDGDWLQNECIQNGINTDLLLRVDDQTGKYISILNPDGSMFIAAAVDSCSKYISPAFLQQHKDVLSKAEMIITDTNISADSISWLAEFCKPQNIKFIIEPVSVDKAKKLAALDLNSVFMITPNEDELLSLSENKFHNQQEVIRHLLNSNVKNIWLRKGEKGSEMFSENKQLALKAATVSITDSTGAGDAALAGWIAAHYWKWDELECLKAGHSLAAEVLQVMGAVAPDITKEKLSSLIKKYYTDES